jgi:hypothetical protein
MTPVAINVIGHLVLPCTLRFESASRPLRTFKRYQNRHQIPAN